MQKLLNKLNKDMQSAIFKDLFQTVVWLVYVIPWWNQIV